MIKCNKCLKELEKGNFYVIREGKKISQRFCSDCYQEYIFSLHHKFWTCYKCYEGGDLPKGKYFSACPKCHSKSIWFSEINEAEGEKVIACDDFGDFPAQQIKKGWLTITLMAIISIAFCGLICWILNREEEKSINLPKQKPTSLKS